MHLRRNILLIRVVRGQMPASQDISPKTHVAESVCSKIKNQRSKILRPLTPILPGDIVARGNGGITAVFDSTKYIEEGNMKRFATRVRVLFLGLVVLAASLFFFAPGQDAYASAPDANNRLYDSIRSGSFDHRLQIRYRRYRRDYWPGYRRRYYRPVYRRRYYRPVYRRRYYRPVPRRRYYRRY